MQTIFYLGPIGWNIAYEWMDSDFQTSREQLYLYLQNQEGVPLRTLNYMVAECNYGGRVTDDKDVRLICCVLERYFSHECANEECDMLSSLPHYYVPKTGSTLTDVREYISNLPIDEDPRVFALHPNALITAQIEQARSFLDTVESVQPRAAGGGGVGKKPEDLAQEMATDILERLPESMKRKNAHEDTYAKTPEGGIVSLGVFHGQELAQFNALNDKIRGSCIMMGKAIKGLVVMSVEMEDMYNAFLVQKVPGIWMKCSYPCLKPLNSYVNDAFARMEHLEGWLRNGPPISFWVMHYFRLKCSFEFDLINFMHCFQYKNAVAVLLRCG